MGVTTRIGVAMGEVRESEGSPRIRLFLKRQNERQQQGIGESSSATSTFAIRDDAGTMGERCERMGVTARIGVAMGEARGGARMWHSPRILFVEGQDEREQGSRESSSTGSTFATRGEGGGAERREHMGVTARIGVAMGEMQVGRRAVGLLT